MQFSVLSIFIKETKQQKQGKTTTKALSCPFLTLYLDISLLSQHAL